MEFLSEVRCMLYAYFLSLREEYNDDDAEGRDEENEDDDDDDDDEDAMMMTTTTTMRGRTAFRMHHDGEVDVRATYCVLTSCYLLKLLDREGDDDGDENDDGRGGCSINPLLSPSVSRYVASCQTYEGGFGAEPNNEAHGGYAFCAIASLRLLLLHRSSGGAAAAGGGGRRLSLHDVIDVNALSSWLSRRQMGYEGGFSGRTNKLVDGCYSFWQGGAIAALDGCPRPGEEEEGGGEHDDEDDDGDGEARDGRRSPTFDEAMLQRYILLCAQDVNGGLRDKPSKSRDFYHSCYNLSGLSVAQHALGPWPPTSATSLSSSTSTTTAADAAVDGHDGGDEAGGEEEEKEVEEVEEEVRGETRLNRLFGDASFNVVGRTDPVINIRVERVRFMLSRRYR
jgi:protein farnesyltransferase subunit beta